MLVIGFVVALPAFIYWEKKIARHPLVPFHLLKERTILAGLTMAVMLNCSWYLQGDYLCSSPFPASLDIAPLLTLSLSFQMQSSTSLLINLSFPLLVSAAYTASHPFASGLRSALSYVISVDSSGSSWPVHAYSWSLSECSFTTVVVVETVLRTWRE